MQRFENAFSTTVINQKTSLNKNHHTVYSRSRVYSCAKTRACMYSHFDEFTLIVNTVPPMLLNMGTLEHFFMQLFALNILCIDYN